MARGSRPRPSWLAVLSFSLVAVGLPITRMLVGVVSSPALLVGQKYANAPPASVTDDALKDIAALRAPVLVMFVTPGFLEQLHSWLCNTARMGDVHARTALFATSTDALLAVRAWGFPVRVFVFGSGGDAQIGDEEAVYGDASRKHLVLRRQQLVEELLVRGIALLLVDIDYVWLRNPFEDPRVVAAPDVDVVATHSSLGPFDTVCACFLRLNANPRTLAFWRASVKHLDEAIAASPVNASVVEQPSIEAAFYAHRSAHGLTATFLPLYDYATGQIFVSSYFDEFGSAAVRPYLVHNNWLRRSGSHFSSKAHRAKFYGLWFLRDDGECDARRIAEVIAAGRPITCKAQLVDSRISRILLPTPTPSLKDACVDEADFGFGSRFSVARDADRSFDAAGINETLSWMKFMHYRQYCAMRDVSCAEVAAPVRAGSLAGGGWPRFVGARWRRLVSLLLDRSLPTSRILAYEPGQWGRAASSCAAESPLCYLQPLGRCEYAAPAAQPEESARSSSVQLQELRLATWTDAQGEAKAQAGLLRGVTPPAVAPPPFLANAGPLRGRRAASAAAVLFALQPTAAVAARIDETRAELGLRHPYLAMHMRGAESSYDPTAFGLNVSEYMAVARAFRARYGVSTVFVVARNPGVVQELLQYESAGWRFVIHGGSTRSLAGARTRSLGGGAVDALVELYLSAHADYWIGSLAGDLGVLTLLLQHGLYGRVGPFYALDRPTTGVFDDNSSLPLENQFLSGQTFDCDRYFDRVRLPVYAGDREQFHGSSLA